MEINNFPNYLIYPDGRLFCKKRQGCKEGFKKGNINHDGYYRTGLTNESCKDKKYYIHRLVAEHYIPNPNNLPEVDHIDRNTINNDVSNLRWADRTTQNRNKGSYKSNTSGFTNIYKKRNKWMFRDTKTTPITTLYRYNKIDVICYKFIHALKLKSDIIKIHD